ncbi:hypothetical protein RA24_16755 [Leisingera sp. ANG-M6]|nr:hypothetical protein RA24_16755 [Leisingera sp. ANG-M6]
MPHSTCQQFPQTVHSHWRAAAEAKGFGILQRVKDRYHLLLSCHTCRRTHTSKIFVLMNSQLQCPHCIEARWRDDATAAGLEWAGRDPEDRHYAHYIAPCGHNLRRQFEMVKRAAEGVCDVRCELCQQHKEQEEASAQGWELIGPDPNRNQNYRLYQHQACGHVQRIARANMQTGRFQCGSCGEGWSSAPSFLYVMQLKLANGAKLIKLGYSRDPVSRLYHQILKTKETEAQVLRTVPVSSGHTAVQIEKGLHALLKAEYPGSVAPPDLYAGELRVKSEVYFPDVCQVIFAMLNTVKAEEDS